MSTLFEKLDDGRGGIRLYGIAPPKLASTSERLREIAAAVGRVDVMSATVFMLRQGISRADNPGTMRRSMEFRCKGGLWTALRKLSGDRLHG